jgi:phosphatidylserine/phosphatidylglycerophosphate/cardiolipin synthase-like enzyme
LADDGGALVLGRVLMMDTVNEDGGPWPAGTKLSGDRRSMERIDPGLGGGDANWGTWFTQSIELDASGQPISGTPGYTNSVYWHSVTEPGAAVVINEIAWAGTGASYLDEWIELYNTTNADIDLRGWLLQAADGIPAVLLTGAVPARGFYLLERTDDSTVASRPADQIYKGPLEDEGETLYLYASGVVDAVVYGDAEPSFPGWVGPPLQPYDEGSLAVGGQILVRKHAEFSGLPVTDTNQASDWANDSATGDVLYGPVSEGDIYGKRAQYPGWTWQTYTHTFQVAAAGYVTVGIAPDNAYTVVAGLLNGAQESILVEGYTFESVWLTGILTERIAAGVQVTMLLEGAPAGGMSDQELWNCDQIVSAGGHVYMMHNDPVRLIYDRYANQHAKFILVDDRWLAVSTENFGNGAMPVDDKTNGTAGRRGVVLITDQNAAVHYARGLYERDCDPARYRDIVAYGSEARYVVPPTYTAVYSTGGGGFEYMAPFSVTMPAYQADHFEIVHAPETSLRYSDGLIALLLQAGPEDEVYVEQLYERLHWGASDSDVFADPNPRLEAYIQAARNGARVRILLDSGLDDRRQNDLTALYVLDVARREGLDLDARLGNPTRQGIHNKMVLAGVSGAKYVHIGSINGSEASFKVNRELALQVRSAAAYDYLKGVFEYDWSHSSGPHEVLLPLVSRNYVPVADHVLISEVMFKQDGTAELGEWIELYNPTAEWVPIGGWYLGDAVQSTDYERMYAFPPGVAIPAGETLVVARRAIAYQELGYPGKPLPDFEWNDSGDVPNLFITPWGDGELELGNGGDEVLLFDPLMQVVDVVVYGTGSFPGVTSFGNVDDVFNGNSLERWPANRDSDDCSYDLHIRYTPDPGHVDAW